LIQINYEVKQHIPSTTIYESTVPQKKNVHNAKEMCPLR